MSDAISSVGSAAVSTIGTVAVVGIAAKTVGKTLKFSNGSRTRKASTHKVFSGTKHSSRKSKSYSIWS